MTTGSGELSHVLVGRYLLKEFYYICRSGVFLIELGNEINHLSHQGSQYFDAVLCQILIVLRNALTVALYRLFTAEMLHDKKTPATAAIIPRKRWPVNIMRRPTIPITPPPYRQH